MGRTVALVTGGTRGIGLGIARSLSRRGWDLALCGRRAEADIDGVIDELSRAGGTVHYVQADLSLEADRRRLVDAVVSRYGRIDALVNNAGRAPRVRADLIEASEESFAEVLSTNLQGPYFLTQAVARLMIERRRRDPASRLSIVFITSISAEAASPNRGEYCVSKAGLSMAAKLFAVRLAADGIPVFEVRPGIIETDMTSGVREIYGRRIAEGLVPAGRWGTPADVGEAVAALVGGDLQFATGSVLNVDGGLHLPRL